jgi:hypothetical protein
LKNYRKRYTNKNCVTKCISETNAEIINGDGWITRGLMGRGNKHPLKKIMGGWGPRSTFLGGLAAAQVGMSTIENVNLIKCRKHNFFEKYEFSKSFVNLLMYRI